MVQYILFPPHSTSTKDRVGPSPQATLLQFHPYCPLKVYLPTLRVRAGDAVFRTLHRADTVTEGHV